MASMYTAMLLACVFACSFWATGMIRRHAVRLQLIDIPNARSSHTTPVPRGGGMVFALIVLLGGLVLFMTGKMDAGLAAALAVGGGAVAWVGWLDDRKRVSAPFRLAVHFLAAAWALACLGCPDAVDLGFLELRWGWWGYAFFFLAIAWLVNSYNFMDGIDGLAGGEAVTVGLAGAALAGGAATLPALLAAAAVAGFLIWNRPPAKIFMGDAGSGFLGYVMGLFWLSAAGEGQAFFVWPILLAVFLGDATITLVWRMAKGETWYAAHCSHAYQAAARRWGHGKVAAAVVLVNVLWLTPCAAAAAAWPRWQGVCFVCAYLPLMCACIYIKRRL